jgi:hypothetical protein
MSKFDANSVILGLFRFGSLCSAMTHFPVAGCTHPIKKQPALCLSTASVRLVTIACKLHGVFDCSSIKYGMGQKL